MDFQFITVLCPRVGFYTIHAGSGVAVLTIIDYKLYFLFKYLIIMFLLGW